MLLTVVLAACAAQPVPGPAPDTRPGPTWPAQDGAPAEIPHDIDAIPDAEPRPEPRAERGNPPFYEVLGQRYYVLDSAAGHVERGIASWYGTKFHGRSTSSGEPYDMFAMTAAHRHLPLPTYARVTNLENGRSVVVRINDRGPFARDRVIDLSYTAAAKLGIIERGTGLVEVRALDPRAPGETEPTVQESAQESPVLYIQVGAFARRQNAVDVTTRLEQAKLYNVSMESRAGESPRLWRVRIGPLGNVEEIDRVSARLHELGFDDARVVIE